MATHRFACDVCEILVEDDNLDVHQCPNCKEDMRCVINVTAARGDYRHVSQSLAINPSQAVAHKKLFPDVDVLPDGQLLFNSVRSQSQYLEKTGFHKEPQKIKPGRVRIA